MSERPEYPLKITINGRSLSHVVIDQHYRVKHGQSMNDDVILDLVKTLDEKEVPARQSPG